MSNLFKGLGGCQTVDFLRIEAAEAHSQDFFDVAEGAPQEVVGLRRMEDIDGLFGIPLWAWPWRRRVRPAQYGDQLIRAVEVIMSDIVKKSDFFEQLAVFVAGPDEAQGFLSPEREADLIGYVVVRLGDVGDEGVCRLDP